MNSLNTNGYLFLYGIFLIALDLDDPPVNARDCCRRHRQMVVVVSGRGSVVLVCVVLRGCVGRFKVCGWLCLHLPVGPRL